MIKRHDVDLSVEKRIVIGSIVSTEFLEGYIPFYDPRHIQNEFAKTALKWAVKYYESYSKAPGKHIEYIFEAEKEHMDHDEAEILATLLSELSEQYTAEAPGFNVPYVIDQAELYCKSRELKLRSDAIRGYLVEGKVEEAEDLMTGYNRVAKTISGWYNPFSPEVVSNVFRSDEMRASKLFKLPGRVGDLIGTLERGWLLSIFGPFKRGKTWWLQEFAIIALLHNLKVALFSFEMNEENTNERIYKRVTAYCEDGGQFTYPTMDCAHNQIGECDLPRRKSRVKLLRDDGTVPEFVPDMTYVPCTECRGNGVQFAPATWFETIERPGYKLYTVKDRIQSFVSNYGDNMRIKVYPKFSANCQTMERDLMLLERTDDFIPDLIVADYAGAMAPEDARETGVQRADTTWKTLAGMAQRRKALLATGSQGTRASIYKKDVQQDDLAEWIGQLAHVDVLFGLNQMGDEKRRGIMRIGLLAHRHKEFFEDQQALVLQNLKLGQVNLDSEITTFRE